MKKLMLVNVVEPEETRIAILEDGVLEEFYIERSSRGQIVGNIYKAKITNVEPALQAAFVDFGGPRNGFLHISDVMASNYQDKKETGRKKPGGNKEEKTEGGGGKKGSKDLPSIQSVLKRGQELLVQVTKEGFGNKGPAVTTYLSLPGRYLVMMPDVNHHGISRKIDDETQRSRLKKLVGELALPTNVGVIVRTAGVGRTKRDLSRDLHFLRKMWADLSKKAKKAKAPARLYQESNLVIRAIRDILPADVKEMVIDSEGSHRRVTDFLKTVMPRQKIAVKLYESGEPLFHKYGIEDELEKTYRRKVSLEIGASLVFDQTEALVAIDVNSGKFKEEKNAEETAYKTNMAAVPEIARQLRLRDLGGVVIIDFIDMRSAERRRSVEKSFTEHLKRDRAKTKTLRMSQFGIIEMTRQRVRPSVTQSIYQNCPVCNGQGILKTPESMALNVMRMIKAKLSENSVRGVEAGVSAAVAHYLNNAKRRQIVQLEEEFQKRILINARDGFAAEQVDLTAMKGERGRNDVERPAGASLSSGRNTRSRKR